MHLSYQQCADLRNSLGSTPTSSLNTLLMYFASEYPHVLFPYEKPFVDERGNLGQFLKCGGYEFGL